MLNNDALELLEVVRDTKDGRLNIHRPDIIENLIRSFKTEKLNTGYKSTLITKVGYKFEAVGASEIEAKYTAIDNLVVFMVKYLSPLLED